MQTAYDRLKAVTCFLLDMDGTFYLGNSPLPGALDFIHILEQKGISYLFLTNNSSKNIQTYYDKLARMGLPTKNVLSSGQAAATILKERFGNAPIYILGNENLRDEMAKAGITLAKDSCDAAALCMGYDTELTYKKLCIACDIARKGKPYIATHLDFNCPVESDTGFEPDAGSFAALIEAATGRRPDLVIGKPNAPIVQAALARTGAKVENAAMVGDRLYTDIATGRAFGMLSILVLTGEATKEDLKTTPHVPDLVFDKLYDIANYL